MIRIIILYLFLGYPLITSSISAQILKADIEGDVKIRGSLDFSRSEDIGSITIGNQAGISMDFTESRENTVVGTEAGRFTSTGDKNSFFGWQTGWNSNTGEKNAFFGHTAGFGNQGGNRNSFFGYETGLNSTGNGNSFFGSNAGADNATGTNNTYIGYLADKATDIIGDSLDRSIVLGAFAKVECSNCAVIGGTGINAVNVGIGTSLPSAPLEVVKGSVSGPQLILKETTGSFTRMRFEDDDFTPFWDIAVSPKAVGNATTSKFNIFYSDGSLNVLELFGDGDATLAGMLTENSDIRLKSNISSLSSVLPKIMTLNAYKYHWKDRVNDKAQIGLIAQEVAEQFPELVKTGDSGVLSVAYTKFVPLLIESIKEQQNQIESQENTIREQKEQIDLINDRLKVIEALLDEKNLINKNE